MNIHDKLTYALWIYDNTCSSTVGFFRVLGAAGLAAAVLSAAAGFLARPLLLGISGALMIAANLYALAHRGRK